MDKRIEKRVDKRIEREGRLALGNGKGA